MKKISLFIFILLIIINIITPFGVVLNSNEIKINKNIIQAEENCTIISAKWDPSGEQDNGFYQQFKTIINIIVKTKNCVDNSNLSLTIFEEDGIITSLTDDTWNDSELKDRSITVPSDNFTVNIQAGEEDCGSTLGGELGTDCDLYFKIMNNGSVIYNSSDNSSGFLYYDCEVIVAGGCYDKAKLLKIIDNGTDIVPVELNKEDQSGTKPDIYTLLAPIGDLETAPDNIGDYFNTMFEIIIGICAVLAVVMIVIGGIQYMGNESVFGKTEAKSQIWRAILGLLIALASFALLNTIDPNLLGRNGLNIKQVSAEIVDLPDAGDGTIDSDFKKSTGSYSKDASISSGVVSAVNKLKDGWVIDSFKVYTNNRMLISLKKGGSVDNTSVIDIRPGLNGYTEESQAKTGDRKTPKGSWKILSIRTAPDGKPVYNKTGSNMGASFWLLSPMKNGERGIGMHGNKNGTLSNTYGCIRLKNADILALLPYVKVGIPVVVTN